MVKLTSEVLEAREQEDDEEEYDDDEDLADELDDLKNEMSGKNTIQLGKFKNEDLDGDEAILEDGDDFDDFGGGGSILYDSPMEEVCEVLYFRNIL